MLVMRPQCIELSDEWLTLTEHLTGVRVGFGALVATLESSAELFHISEEGGQTVVAPASERAAEVLSGGVAISTSEHYAAFRYVADRLRQARLRQDQSDRFLAVQLARQAGLSRSILELLADGELAVLVDREAMLEQLDAAPEIAGEPVVQAYLQASAMLAERDILTKARYLTLAAARLGAREIVRSLDRAFPVLGWRAVWSRTASMAPSRAVSTSESSAICIAVAGSGSGPVAAASGYAGGVIGLTDLASESTLRLVTGARGEVRSVALRLVGGSSLVAAVTSDHYVVAVDGDSERVLWMSDDVHDAPLSTIAISDPSVDQPVVYASGVDRRLTARLLRTGELLAGPLYVHGGEIRAIRSVITAVGHVLLVAGVDGVVAVIDASTGEVISTVNLGCGVLVALDVSCADDGVTVYAASLQGTLCCMQLLDDGSLTVGTRQDLDRGVNGIRVAPIDADVYVVIAHTDQSWSCWRTGEQLECMVPEARGHFSAVMGIDALSSDGDLSVFTAGADGTVRRWGLAAVAAASRRLDRPVSRSGAVTAAAIARSTAAEPLVATGYVDGELRLWHPDLPSGVTGGSHHFDTVRAVLVEGSEVATGLHVVSGSDDGTIWSTAIGRDEQHSRVLGTAHDGVTCLERLPTKEFMFASGGLDGSVAVWDHARSSVEATTSASPYGRVSALAMIDQLYGQVLAAMCEDGTVCLFDPASLRLLEGDRLAVSPLCGAGLAGRETGLVIGGDNGEMVVLTGRNCLTGGRQGVRAHTGGVTALCTMEIEGRPIIVSGGPDRHVRIWDSASLAMIEEIKLGGALHCLHGWDSRVLAGTSAGVVLLQLDERSLRHGV